MNQICYQEALFTVKTCQNRYDIHKQVMDAYAMGAPFDERTFIYDVRVINEEYSAITIREPKLPVHFNPASKTETFIEGDKREFVLAINLVRRSEGKTKPVGCIETFLQERLQATGWDEIQIADCITHLIPVKKRNHSLNLFIGKVTVSATITDPDKVAKGFIHGIGRAKGFGVGTMMLKAK